MRRSAALAAVSVLAACSAGDAPLPATARVHEVRAGGCSGGDRLAVGTDVGAGLVLTVAHVLRGATAVTVGGRSATVVALDHRRDAALLAIGGDSAPIAFVPLRRGPAHLVTVMGERDVRIERAVTVRIDEPRDATTYERAGLVIAADVARGESGAVVVDDDGRLAGMVFAASRTGGRAYAVSAGELSALVVATDPEGPEVDTGAC